MKKIVIFTHYLKGGGAERRASIYAEYFYKNNYDVTVVTLYKVDGEYPLDPSIKRIFLYESRKQCLSVSKFKRVEKLQEIYESIIPDYVFSFMQAYALSSALCKRRSKILKNCKCIYCVAIYQRMMPIHFKVLDRLACIYSDYINLQCEEQKKCNKLWKKKCFVTYNPFFDFAKEENIKTFSTLNIMSVGRLVWQKNFFLSLKACVKAYQMGVNLKFDIFGAGKNKKRIESFIKKNNANEYIKLNDYTLNIYEEYKKHNAFILSSHYEGFPNSLAEAMIFNNVVFAKACPTGPKEMISHGNNGFLFSNKKELIQQICLASKDPNICEKMSINARNSILERFSADVVLKDITTKIQKF